MTLEFIQKLTRIASKLKSKDKLKQAQEVEKIIEFLKTSYKMHFKRQRKGRGLVRQRRKQYYKKNKAKILRKHKKYRLKYKNMLRRRRRLRHHKRT